MKFDVQVDILRQMIEESHNIVAITGAGISVPSGIPDFRSAKGLYRLKSGGEKPGEYMLSHTCFVRDREDFFKYYKKAIIHREAKPNIAHEFLADLETKGKLKAIITQNIDGLHQMAGSQNAIEFHGSIHRNYCTNCNKFYSLDYVADSDGVPKCTRCGGVVKPDVVLYEEGIRDENIENSLRAINEADMLIVIGTSLVVYPAAGLINYYHGDKLVLINKSNTGYDEQANLVINGDIIDVVQELTK